MSLTYRPFASFAGRLREAEVASASDILREHQDADATKQQTAAAKQKQLSEANHRRIVETAGLDTVPTAMTAFLREALDQFGMSNYKVTKVSHPSGSEFNVTVQGTVAGSTRTYTVTVK